MPAQCTWVHRPVYHIGHCPRLQFSVTTGLVLWSHVAFTPLTHWIFLCLVPLPQVTEHFETNHKAEVKIRQGDDILIPKKTNPFLCFRCKLIYDVTYLGPFPYLPMRTKPQVTAGSLGRFYVRITVGTLFILCAAFDWSLLDPFTTRSWTLKVKWDILGSDWTTKHCYRSKLSFDTKFFTTHWKCFLASTM